MPRKTSPGMPSIHRSMVASMRPRPDAAENRDVARVAAVDGIGFNEAAARCRGKRAIRPPLPVVRIWLQ